MKEFNENPFLKDTPVIPFSNGSEADNWLEKNCNQCCKTNSCELKNNVELGFIEGTIPLWNAKEIGCDYNPLYGHVDLYNTCRQFRTGAEPF